MIIQIIKFILVVLVGVFTYYEEQIVHPIIKVIIVIFLAVGILFFETIIESFKEFRVYSARKKIISKLDNNITFFLKKYLNKTVNNKKLRKTISLTKYDSVDSYSEIFDSILDENLFKKKEIILSIFYCYLIDNLKNSIKIGELKEKIDLSIRNFFFNENNFSLDKQLINSYYNFLKNEFLFLDPPVIDSEKLQSSFLNKYGTSTRILLGLYLEKDQIEEFRKTLAELDLHGKVDGKLLEKTIYDEMKNISKTKEKIILFISHFFQRDEGLKSYLDKFDGLAIPHRFPLGNFPKEFKTIHTRLIVLPPQISPKNFFNTCQYLIKNSSLDGFLGLFNLSDHNKLTIYPDNSNIIKNPNVKKTYELIKNFNKKNIQNKTSNLIDININKALSIIPFNIYFPKIKPKARAMIIDNYFDLKEKFKINTLIDWADIDVNELKKTLIRLDDNKNAKIYTDDYWGKISIRLRDLCLMQRNSLIGKIDKSASN